MFEMYIERYPRIGWGRDSLRVYFKEISRVQPLSQDEEKELAERFRKGDQSARDKLVEANLKWVVYIAKKYQGHGMSLSELISAGNVGLIKAAEKFRGSRGIKFVIYATWWIRKYIMDALNQETRTIRLPSYRVKELVKCRKFMRWFQQIYGHEPTEREIAQGTEISGEDLNRIKEFVVKPVSLDQIRDEYGDKIYDLIARKNISSNDENIFLEEIVRELLNTLSFVERRTIEFRFGLDNENICTLQQVGKELGLTAERVRQIERKAIRRLKENVADGKFKYHYGIGK